MLLTIGDTASRSVGAAGSGVCEGAPGSADVSDSCEAEGGVVSAPLRSSTRAPLTSGLHFDGSSRGPPGGSPEAGGPSTPASSVRGSNGFEWMVPFGCSGSGWWRLRWNHPRPPPFAIPIAPTRCSCLVCEPTLRKTRESSLTGLTLVTRCGSRAPPDRLGSALLRSGPMPGTRGAGGDTGVNRLRIMSDLRSHVQGNQGAGYRSRWNAPNREPENTLKDPERTPQRTGNHAASTAVSRETTGRKWQRLLCSALRADRRAPNKC